MTINWKDHLLSLIVVIVGITIAFYLENWRENQKSARQERAYLQELEHSLMQDSLLLDTLISIGELQYAILDRFLQERPIPIDSVSYHAYTVFYNMPFSPQRAVYESMKSSGGIQSLREFEMAARIMELYEQDYLGMAQWNQAVDEHIRDFYRPFIIEKLQVTGDSKVETDLLQSQEFKSIIVPYRALLSAKLEYYLVTNQRMDSTQRMISSYLN